MKNIFKLLIFLHMGMCFNAHAQVAGTPYIFARPTPPSLPSTISCCVGATISVTPCASVSGTRKNDNNATSGIEYDWSGAVGWLADNDTFRALIEFGGQCWYRYNSSAIPSNFSPAPAYNSSTDVGHHFVPTPASTRPKIGRLYQWSAAMNGATNSRARGVCAPGFHIPSSCESIYRTYNLTNLRWSALIGGTWQHDSVYEMTNIYVPACTGTPSQVVVSGFDRVWQSNSTLAFINTAQTDWGQITYSADWTSSQSPIIGRSFRSWSLYQPAPSSPCTATSLWLSRTHCSSGSAFNYELNYVRCVAD